MSAREDHAAHAIGEAMKSAGHAEVRRLASEGVIDIDKDGPDAFTEASLRISASMIVARGIPTDLAVATLLRMVDVLQRHHEATK